MTALRPVFLLMYGLTALGLHAGEQVRANPRGELQLDAQPVALALDDLIQLPLASPDPYTNAWELEIQLPRDLLAYRLAFAAYIYGGIKTDGKAVEKPAAEAKPIIQFNADRLLLEPFPNSLKFYIQLPLLPHSGLKSTLNTLVVKNLPKEDGLPLGLMIRPIDKGLPPEALKAQFLVRLRAVAANLGGINLLPTGLAPEDRRALKITAGDRLLPSEGLILLPPGLYELNLLKPNRHFVTVKCAVSRGQTTDLEVNLADPPTEIVIEAPLGSEIQLDGQRLVLPANLAPLDIAPGTHTFTIILGDYQLSRTFELQAGRRHRLNLKLDLELTSQ